MGNRDGFTYVDFWHWQRSNSLRTSSQSCQTGCRRLEYRTSCQSSLHRGGLCTWSMCSSRYSRPPHSQRSCLSLRLRHSVDECSPAWPYLNGVAVYLCSSLGGCLQFGPPVALSGKTSLSWKTPGAPLTSSPARPSPRRRCRWGPCLACWI